MGWINDKPRGTYYVNIQIKFKTPMLRSNLCDYSDSYILVSGTTTVSNTVAASYDLSSVCSTILFCFNIISIKMLYQWLNITL